MQVEGPRMVLGPIQVKPPPKPVIKRKIKRKVATAYKAYKTTGYNACSCVLAARAKSGINVGPIGFARNHPINNYNPQVGAVIITNESKAGHVGVVIAVQGEAITIWEGNYRPCQISTRTISQNNPVIRGYYIQ